MDFVCGAISLFALFLTAIILFFHRRFSYWKDRNVPYIEPSFPHGNLKNIGTSKHFRELLNQVYFKFKNQSPLCGTYFSVVPVAIVSDLNLIKSVLIQDFSYFVNRSMYTNEADDPLTANLFMVHGQKWRTLRNKFSTMFTSGKLKYTYPTLVDVSKELVEHINKALRRDKCVEIKDIMARFTTDVIGKAIFGIECNSLANPNAEFRTYGRKVVSESRHSKIIVEFLNQCPQIGRFLKMKFFPDCIIEFFTRVVHETIELREKHDIRRKDFIDLLITMKNETRPDAPKLTMDEIVAQVFIFFGAGFETSSSTMTLALYELARNEELQERARKSVFDVLERHNGQMTYEAIMDMTYLGQVLLETLRKYPTLVALTRKADKNYLVPNTNIMLEKGTGILVPVYSIHHDPDIYPDPEKFDPDRFSPEEVNKRHPMSFLGFGDGPRNCIGMRFGIMQSRLGLATMLKEYHFELSPQTQLPLKFDLKSIVLSLLNGIYIKIEKMN